MPRRNCPSEVTSSFAPGVGHPEAQGLGRESAEHERMHGAEARDRERDDDGLEQHRQVDHHAVAGADAEFGERVRRLRDLPLQLGEGEGAAVAGLALPVVRDLVAESRIHVPVDAVDGDVEGAVGEPLGPRRLQGAVVGERGRPVEGARERRLPVQPARGVRPERDRIGGGALPRIRARRWRSR